MHKKTETSKPEQFSKQELQTLKHILIHSIHRNSYQDAADCLVEKIDMILGEMQ